MFTNIHGKGEMKMADKNQYVEFFSMMSTEPDTNNCFSTITKVIIEENRLLFRK